jgi:RNA polymerase sigma-70 factor (sigma-E family)
MSRQDREQFAEFATAALPTLMRLGHMLTGSADAGADLAQTALVSTLAAWPRVQHEDPFGYVRRTMINANVSTWRRWGSRVRYTEPPERHIGDEPGRVADVVTVRSALATLPPRQRTVLVLRYYCDLSEDEIAREMGVRPGTVKSQAARGLAALRRQLGGDVMGFAGAPCGGMAR